MQAAFKETLTGTDLPITVIMRAMAASGGTSGSRWSSSELAGQAERMEKMGAAEEAPQRGQSAA